MPRGPLLAPGATAEVFAWDDRTVLKLFRPGIPDSWVDHERRLHRWVWEAGLPVPALSGTIHEDGRTGLLFEHVDGPTLLHRLLQSPLEVGTLAKTHASLHHRIHDTPAPDLPPLRPRLTQAIHASPFLQPAEKQTLVGLVQGLSDGDRLLHLDFHPGNIIAGPDGPRVIDWITAARGDPAADVARTTLLFRFARLPAHWGRFKRWVFGRLQREFLARYRDAYAAHGPGAPSDADVERWVLPLAATRLAENISQHERTNLLRWVRDSLD